MIFNNNTTSLVDNVAMAEGYDCSYGAALALVESARNDYAMFRAMLDVDAREFQIKRESAGYVTEGEITALAEAAGAGIWAKIKELFKKLGEKIKAIFTTFVSKINSLWMSDKQLITKYKKLINNKNNLGNLEVKWTKYRGDYANDAISSLKAFNMDDASSNYKEDDDERVEYYLGFKPDDFDDHMKDTYIDGDENDKVEINDIGGISRIIGFLEGHASKLSKLNEKARQLQKTASENIKQAEDKQKEKENANNPNSADIENARKTYDMANAYQKALIRICQWSLSTFKNDYKQNKAAFMKAIAANDSKLKESTYLDAIEEAAAEEVESVISGALSKEELSKICNASLNVKDADVSDDPYRLTYDPDYYSDNQSYVRTDGSIDTDINSKRESAFFGQLFY